MPRFQLFHHAARLGLTCSALGCAGPSRGTAATPHPTLDYTPVVQWDSLPACASSLGLQRGRTLDFRVAGLRLTVPGAAGGRRVSRRERAEVWQDTVAGLQVSAGRGPLTFEGPAGTPLEFVTTDLRDTSGALFQVACDHCFQAAARCRDELAGAEAIVSTGPLVEPSLSTPAGTESPGQERRVAVVAAWDLGAGEWRWLAVEGRAAAGLGRLNAIVRTVRAR